MRVPCQPRSQSQKFLPKERQHTSLKRGRLSESGIFTNDEADMVRTCLVALITWVYIHHTIIGVCARIFSPRAEGTLDRNNLTAAVNSPRECAAICAKKRICSMFSIKELSTGNTPGLMQCNITYGFSSWTPDQNSMLYVGKQTHQNQITFDV